MHARGQVASTQIYLPTALMEIQSLFMRIQRSFRFYSLLGTLETGIYIALGILLAAAALLALTGTVPIFASGVHDFTGTKAIFLLIDRLLLVLLLVELLHTVRISIRSHVLVIEPFLTIGIIAIIRRTLVLTLQAEGFTQNVHWTDDVQANFRASMIEGGMLALLLAVLVGSIYVIRKMGQDKTAEPETALGTPKASRRNQPTAE